MWWLKMHYNGILIGILTFGIIGIFHPIVIKTEYYWKESVACVCSGRYCISRNIFVGRIFFWTNNMCSVGSKLFMEYKRAI